MKNPLFTLLDSLIGKTVKIYVPTSMIFWKKNNRQPFAALAPYEKTNPEINWKEQYPDWKYNVIKSEPIKEYNIDETSRGSTCTIVLENGDVFHFYILHEELAIEIFD